MRNHCLTQCNNAILNLDKDLLQIYRIDDSVIHTKEQFDLRLKNSKEAVNQFAKIKAGFAFDSLEKNGPIDNSLKALYKMLRIVECVEAD